jgi:hypothetical protein
MGINPAAHDKYPENFGFPRKHVQAVTFVSKPGQDGTQLGDRE